MTAYAAAHERPTLGTLDISALSGLCSAVADANRRIDDAGLVQLAFGNASVVDRSAGVMGIKPSGLCCGSVRPEHVVVVGIDDGAVFRSGERPSSDTPTHLALYRAFPAIGAVVHTHSAFATAWAQARSSIPCLGTTHADHFRGPVPVTRELLEADVGGEYESNVGEVIIELFRSRSLDPQDVPGVLVASHGPFAWGATGPDAVANAVALEFIARLAVDTLRIRGETGAIPTALLERHF